MGHPDWHTKLQTDKPTDKAVYRVAPQLKIKLSNRKIEIRNEIMENQIENYIKVE